MTPFFACATYIPAGVVSGRTYSAGHSRLNIPGAPHPFLSFLDVLSGLVVFPLLPACLPAFGHSSPAVSPVIVHVYVTHPILYFVNTPPPQLSASTSSIACLLHFVPSISDQRSLLQREAILIALYGQVAAFSLESCCNTRTKVLCVLYTPLRG